MYSLVRLKGIALKAENKDIVLPVALCWWNMISQLEGRREIKLSERNNEEQSLIKES